MILKVTIPCLTGWKMAIRKGEIYLANLGDVKCADIGKTRPVLIFQNNHLNRMVDDGLYSDVIVIPLSSKIRVNDFSFVLKSRERLVKESTVLCNTIKMIHAKRLLLEKGVLTTLSEHEIHEIEKILMHLFDIEVC